MLTEKLVSKLYIFLSFYRPVGIANKRDIGQEIALRRDGVRIEREEEEEREKGGRGRRGARREGRGGRRGGGRGRMVVQMRGATFSVFS